MTRLRIRHETTYTYQSAVNFGPWRLLMRPADSHSIRVVEASFELSPPGLTRWTYDAYGNSVCHFTPQGPGTQVSIVNNLVIDRFPAPLSPLTIYDPRSLAPIIYETNARVVLAPFISPATDELNAPYHDWLQNNACAPDEPALEYVIRLNRAINQGFVYAPRHEFGTRSPPETIAQGGTCRDLAWLMIETLRRFGFAARFVTGYIYAGSGALGAGATHAWCEVFLPDLGWIGCDPTNGLVESSDLIRVAATRTPEEASPVCGVARGNPGGERMHVSVCVEPDRH